MVAFATADDLAALLNRTFNPDEITWVNTLLEDASTYLRTVIGQQVYPQTQSEYVAYPDAGRVDLPQWPVVSVDSVQRDSVDVTYHYRPGYIVVHHDDPVDVTFTWGYVTAPPELVRVTCVLAAQALQTLETTGSITASGLSSIAIDDFRAAFADGGALTGIALTQHAQRALRAAFGRGDLDVLEMRT